MKVDQVILEVKIKAAQERLAYLESLREPVPGVEELKAEIESGIPFTSVHKVTEKRGPGRPRKAV